eukprot:GGOE01058993.1.p1 GENE.GGOE01058993.1~~GGOE01058993.1.p1  ORF type:complete len:407 (-),score=95.43 GGOE01058993.1:444-1643(-)
MATAEGRPPIYLDYNATTPICEEAVQAMQAYLTAGWPHGNPSSGHGYGQQARGLVEEARQKVALSLSCAAEEVVFTSGGTESNNWAVIGSALQRREQDATKNHIVTSSIEHPAVSEVCRYLQQERGFEVTVVPVDSTGVINVKVFEASLTERTALVTVMHANNETGAIQPIPLLSRIAKAKDKDIIFHTDAAQSIGKIPVSVVDLGVDLLSVCAHKFYGPKGVGALYIRSGVTLKNLLHGAGHERGLRPGTENVLEIIGMAAALELAHRKLSDGSRHMLATRDALHDALKAGLGADNVHLHGGPHRLPNTLYVSLRAPGGEEWCKAAAVLYAVAPYVAASSGSACHSGAVCMSPSLNAMQVPTGLALGAMRLTTGRYLSQEDAVAAAEVLVQAVIALKS